MSDEDDDRTARWKQQDAEYAEADKKFTSAIREYLWSQVRISGAPEWEHEPDFALLALLRVALRAVGYRVEASGMDADEVAQSVIAELIDELEPWATPCA